MSLAEFLAELNALTAAATTAFQSAPDPDALEAARVEFLGAKSGRLKAAQKGLGALAGADKPAAGKSFNDAKQAIEGAFAAAQERLAGTQSAATADDFDLTVPGKPLRYGHRHPITQ